MQKKVFPDSYLNNSKTVTDTKKPQKPRKQSCVEFFFGSPGFFDICHRFSDICKSISKTTHILW